MEMDGIFTQDNIRNTITIISNLGEERREKQVISFFFPSIPKLSYT